MKDYEKQNPSNEEKDRQIEEIDPDYVTGGAEVVPPKETEGLTPKEHTQQCDCGEFNPNVSGTCGVGICENCKHAKKTSDDSSTVYCTKQPIKQIITIS